MPNSFDIVLNCWFCQAIACINFIVDVYACLHTGPVISNIILKQSHFSKHVLVY